MWFRSAWWISYHFDRYGFDGLFHWFHAIRLIRSIHPFFIIFPHSGTVSTERSFTSRRGSLYQWLATIVVYCIKLKPLRACFRMVLTKSSCKYYLVVTTATTTRRILTCIEITTTENLILQVYISSLFAVVSPIYQYEVIIPMKCILEWVRETERALGSSSTSSTSMRKRLVYY